MNPSSPIDRSLFISNMYTHFHPALPLPLHIIYTRFYAFPPCRFDTGRRFFLSNTIHFVIADCFRLSFPSESLYFLLFLLTRAMAGSGEGGPLSGDDAAFVRFRLRGRSSTASVRTDRFGLLRLGLEGLWYS